MDSDGSRHILQPHSKDYRRENTPLVNHILAGALAGLAEHMVTHPLDTLKTRMQTLAAAGDASTKKNLSRLRYFRGMAIIGSSCVPAHAAMFGTYELLRRQLPSGPVSELLSSCCGSLLHDLCMTPADVAKQHLQTGRYATSRAAMRDIWKRHGLAGFYRALPVTLFTNIPLLAVMSSTSYVLSSRLKIDEKIASKDDRTRRKGMALYFLTAGVSGGFAAAVTTPLDVIKTQQQTAHQDLRMATKEVLRVHGIKGFFRGAGERFCAEAPSSAVSWFTYRSASAGLTRLLNGQMKTAP